MTVDLDCPVTVGRSSLSLADLDLNDWVAGAATGVAVVRAGLNVGGVVRENFSVDSEATDSGATLVGSRRLMIPAQLVLRLYGDPSWREAKRAEIAEAFSQFNLYHLNLTIRGVARIYRCWPADSIIPGTDGALEEFTEMSDREVLTVSLMRKPTPVTGSF